MDGNGSRRDLVLGEEGWRERECDKRWMDLVSLGGWCGKLVQWKFLESMRVILGGLLVMGDMKYELTVSYSQVRLPVAGLGYILLNYWPRGPLKIA